MNIIKTKNRQKFNTGYNNVFSNALKNVAGVKSGKLKSSIYDDLFIDKLVIGFVEYGVYINPWVKKTGSHSEPGYKKILDKEIDKYMKKYLEAFGEDIGDTLPKVIRIQI